MKLILFIIMITTVLFAESFKDDGQVGIENNIEKAKATATATLKKARAGNVDSMKLMVKYYENGYGIKTNIKKAKYWKAKATAKVTLKKARTGNLISMELMAWYYEKGYGVKTNIKKAKYWKAKVTAKVTLKKARAGNVDSMKLMTEYYENGYGVKTNIKKAKYWKGKADLIAREKKAEEEKLAREKKAEEERLAREKKAEKEKLVREKQDKEERLAREKLAKRLNIVKESGFSSYPTDTYIDTDTKLMWQDNKDAKSVYTDWNGAKDYCQNLRINEYSDWKLPSYLELLSIFTYKKDNYIIKDGFKNVTPMNYWSSSENVNSNTFAWNVDFRVGEATINSKSIKCYVRCVRGSMTSPAFKITD